MVRVIVFGTFDIFHPGHRSFLIQAKKLGTYLLVVVARDKAVEKIKGKTPRNSEQQRVRLLRKEKLADKVILGSKTYNYFRTLKTYKISMIALGYDQKPTIKQLKKSLKRHRIRNMEIIRLKPYNPKKYKSSLLAKINVKQL